MNDRMLGPRSSVAIWPAHDISGNTALPTAARCPFTGLLRHSICGHAILDAQQMTLQASRSAL
jgi:hypothetical protein